MKVRIEFPEDIAKEKAEEAKEWEPGDPMIWEAEDINVPEKVKREGDNIIIETKHTKVELTKEEVEKIKSLHE
jgi:hypothetical protein